MKPKTLSPILTAKGVRLAIAVGRFNERVTKLLLEGALEAYARLGGGSVRGPGGLGAGLL